MAAPITREAWAKALLQTLDLPGCPGGEDVTGMVEAVGADHAGYAGLERRKFAKSGKFRVAEARGSR